MGYVEWTPDMGEISGFGGSYEDGCRAMVKAGVEFWEAEQAKREAAGLPNFNPEFKGFRDVYGILFDENEDAKALTEAMIAAVRGKGGATGAMHQASVSHVLAFHNLGAEEYCRILREREDPGDGGRMPQPIGPIQ